MSATHRLMFAGQPMPGVDPARLHAILTERLKLTREQADLIFSGKAVSLKKFTNAHDAETFQARLTALGAKVWVETIGQPFPTLNPISNFPKQVAPPPPPAPQNPLGLVPAEPRVEEIDCPSCGERQPKRTLCRKCAADIPRVLAAREQTTRENLLSRADVRDGRSQSPASSAPSQTAHDTPALFGLGIHGRIGRVTYLLGNFAISALVIPMVVLGFRLQSLVAMSILLILSGILCLRLTILRCHDLGWSQWLAAVQLIPYVGGIFTLILLVVPGNRAENDHGLPTPIAGWAPLAVCVVIAVGSAFSIRKDVGTMMMAMAAAQGKGKAVSQPAQSLQAEADPPVILYSDSGCRQCATRRQELANAGIQYREISLDDYPAARVRIREALLASGMDGNAISTPMLEVNGMLLPDGTGVAEVQAFLQTTR